MNTAAHAEPIHLAAEPFLKWAGGKRQLWPELQHHVPVKFGRYFEPFAGGLATFFALFSHGQKQVTGYDLEPGRAVLGDANELLVATYLAVRDNVAGVCAELRAHKIAHAVKPKEHYYATRAHKINIDWKDQTSPRWAAAAARMIYLNRTCFNGLWRVNRSGQFNVPMGRYKNPTILDEPALYAASRMLQHQLICRGDFMATIDAGEPRKGDFIYFDPPYWPVGGYADFTQFTKEPFGKVEQEKLRDVALRLKKRGVRVLLSNADLPPVRELYKQGFEMRSVAAKRHINSDPAKRGNVKELIIW